MLKYKFAPTTLDKFQSYIDTHAEDYFYQDAQGKWHKNYNEAEDTLHFSHAEVDALLKQELIDSINKIPHEPSEAASKGTALNEIVDCLIHNRQADRKDIVIKSLKGFGAKREFGCTDESGKPFFYDYWFEHIKKPCIYAGLDGFDFYFDIDFCKSIAEYFKGSSSQVFTSATLETKYGEVELHGYIDELRENKVFDLKTTSRYEFGKYAKYWQRHAYPYTLIESGVCTEINSFEFTAYALKGGTSRTPLITGVQYPEVYQHDHEQSKVLLKDISERFIEFIEENRKFITNRKIFNEE